MVFPPRVDSKVKSVPVAMASSIFALPQAQEIALAFSWARAGCFARRRRACSSGLNYTAPESRSLWPPTLLLPPPLSVTAAEIRTVQRFGGG